MTMKSKSDQGQSVSFDFTEAVKSAPSAKGNNKKHADTFAAPKPLSETVKETTKHKGPKPGHQDHPAMDPYPHAAPYVQSHDELTGHKPKAPKKSTKNGAY